MPLRLALPALAAVLLVLMGLAADTAPRPNTPNVVLISVDTLRADHLNAYGYKDRKVSPEIDRLAADGILFAHHVSASPWTTPSHLSLFTSLSPTAHGVTTTFSRLRQALRTGADVDRLADEHETLAETLARIGYRTGAFTGGATLDPRIGFEQGFASYDTSMAKLDESRLRALVQWVGEAQDRPFFLFWHTFEVHAPYLQDEFVDEVLPREQAARVSKTIAGLQKGGTGALPAPSVLSRKLAAQKLLKPEVCASLYDGGVRSADAWIGRFLDELKRAKLYDHTIVVLTSDHGEQLGETAGPGGSPARDGRS